MKNKLKAEAKSQLKMKLGRFSIKTTHLWIHLALELMMLLLSFWEDVFLLFRLFFCFQLLKVGLTIMLSQNSKRFQTFWTFRQMFSSVLSLIWFSREVDFEFRAIFSLGRACAPSTQEARVWKKTTQEAQKSAKPQQISRFQ